MSRFGASVCLLPHIPLVLSETGSLELRLVSSAILENINSSTSRIWLRLDIVRMADELLSLTKHWQTVQTQIRRRRTRRLIRVCSVCLNYRTLRINWNSFMSRSGLFHSLHSEKFDPVVLSMLWFFFCGSVVHDFFFFIVWLPLFFFSCLWKVVVRDVAFPRIFTFFLLKPHDHINVLLNPLTKTNSDQKKIKKI